MAAKLQSTSAKTIDRSPTARSFVLDAVLDLRAASDLARSLDGLRGEALAIDPAQVSRLGAQCAQVLVSAAKTWSSDGLDFSVAPGSAPFVEGLELLGLTSFFNKQRAN